MSAIRAVFMDIDNTMYDLESSLETAVRATHTDLADQLGTDLPRFEAAYWSAVNAIEDPHAVLARGLDAWRRRCMAGTVDELGLDDDGLVERLAATFDAHRMDALEPFPGALEALDRIAEDHTLGVITNGPSQLQRQKVERLGVADRVADELIIVSGEHPWAKPAPDLFRHAAERAGVPPESCVMVGDSPDHDIPAAAIGYRTVLVNAKDLPVPPMEHSPNAVVTTPAELPDVLSQFS